LQKKDSLTIYNGDSVVFKILVWNRGDPYLVRFRVSSLPEGWSVIVNPNNFILNSTPEGYVENMNLPGLTEPLKAKVVNVFVKPPETAGEGVYNIAIDATAGNPGEQISILQERTFNFEVEIKRPKTIFDDITDNLVKFFEDTGITGMFTSESPTNLSILIVLTIIILLAAWRFYRHA
jgi:hypothetical protein